MAILECRGLAKSFGGIRALDNVELALQPGRIVGLLGPNGSGKTTLIKLANGLLTPTSGQILIDGQAPGVESKKIVSYLPERSCLGDWMKVSDLLDFFSDFYADFRRDTAQEMLSRLSIDPRQTFGHLSKGTTYNCIIKVEQSYTAAHQS